MSLVASRRSRLVSSSHSKGATNNKKHCDRILPACKQCSARNRQGLCLYRQRRLDLVLHDETVSTKPRRWRNQQESRHLQTLTACADEDLVYQTAILQLARPCLNMSMYTTDFHLCVLMKHGACYQFLPLIMSQTTGILDESVKAISMRCLSLTNRIDLSLPRAREHHSVALRAVSQQVSYASLNAKTEETVATILLLALFSLLSSNAAVARKVWTTHMDGVTAILHDQYLRSLATGVSSLMHPRLLSHVLNSIHISHLQCRRILPQHLSSLYDCLPDSAILVPRHRIIDTLAHHNQQHQMTIRNLSYRLQSLLNTDKDACAILEHLEKTIPYAVKSPVRPDEPICHEYQSINDMQEWNFTRVLRLRINEEIARLIEQHGVRSLCAEQQLRVLHLRTVLAPLAFDIFASIPSYLRNSDQQLIVESDMIHWAHALIWPLAQVQASPYIPFTLLPLVNHMVEHLCQSTGFPGAYSPRQQDDDQTPLKDWYVVFRSDDRFTDYVQGSCAFLALIIPKVKSFVLNRATVSPQLICHSTILIYLACTTHLPSNHSELAH